MTTLKKIIRKTLFLFGICFAIALLWIRFFPIPNTSYMIHEKARLGAVKYDWISLNYLPDHIPASVIAAEDSGFCNHHGVEWQVLWKLINEGADRGGSTISQQMVKNLFLWQGETTFSKYARKAIEVPLTLIVELALPKKRIVEIYLNIIEYDTGVFGIEQAALHHFNVNAKDLSPRQMALLAAVLPNPKSYQAVPAGDYVAGRAKQIERGARDVVGANLNECVN